MDRPLVTDDPRLNQPMLVGAFTTGAEFFRVVDEEFLPTVDERDGATAQSIATGQLNEIYDRHHDAIVETVEVARAKQAQIESSSTAQVRRLSALSIAAFVIGLVLALGVSVLVAQAITRSVLRLAQRGHRRGEQARGADLDREVPVIEPVELGTTDELAEAAAAFNTVVGTTVDLLEQQARGRKALSEMFVNLSHAGTRTWCRASCASSTSSAQEADSENLEDLRARPHRHPHAAQRREPPRDGRPRGPTQVEEGGAGARRAALGGVRGRAVRAGRGHRHRPGAGQRQDAAANLAHLVAELTGAALRFSPPDTKVIIAGQRSRQGPAAHTITDRGTGMAEADLRAANQRLADHPGWWQHRHLLGHFVVGRLAERHDIAVELQPGDVGLTVLIELPGDILAPMGEDRAPADRDGYQRTRTQQKLTPARPRRAPSDPAAVTADPERTAPEPLEANAVSETQPTSPNPWATRW